MAKIRIILENITVIANALIGQISQFHDMFLFIYFAIINRTNTPIAKYCE